MQIFLNDKDAITFSGYITVGEAVVAQSEQVRIKFQSDASVNEYKRFKISYQAGQAANKNYMHDLIKPMTKRQFHLSLTFTAF